MTHDFKFQIGDIVTFKSNCVAPVPRVPHRLIVIGQQMHRHENGDRLRYEVRVTTVGAHNSGQESSWHVAAEQEIVPWSEYQAALEKEEAALAKEYAR